ncbi:MAG: DUF3341 domain-containing protein [Acidobacteria bacterium]|nr:DUF3341 domain-containing protein [Acidobacteriota bacterium]
MSARQVVGLFSRDEDVVAATAAARRAGLSVVDVFTPYPVHGLDKAMGLPPSRLAWVCLIAGLSGAVLKLWFELWTAMVDWPLNVGGKPHNSLPAFVPITFEVMVLFAGLATVGAFLAVSGLRPGRKPHAPHPRVTDDSFALVVRDEGGAMTGDRIRALFVEHHALDVQERIDPGEPRR